MSDCRINRLSEVLAFALKQNCNGSSISNVTFLNINLAFRIDSKTFLMTGIPNRPQTRVILFDLVEEKPDIIKLFVSTGVSICKILENAFLFKLYYSDIYRNMLLDCYDTNVY